MKNSGINELVSIIVPIYNVEKYVVRCAESLLSQTYADIEYIFVNDCTPDKSIEVLFSVLNKYPQRYSQVYILNNDTNRGLAYCRNRGVQSAHGGYIMHVDSDDYIKENAVEVLVSLAKQKNADIVISNPLRVSSNNIVEDSYFYPVEIDKYLKDLLRRNLPVNIWGKLFKRGLYLDNNIAVPENIDFGEDMVTLPRLVYYASKIAVSPPFYYYNQLNANSYTKRIGEKAISSVIRTERILRDFFSDKMDRKELDGVLSVYMQKMRTEMLFNTSTDLRKKYVSLFSQCGCVNLHLISSFRQRVFIALFDRHFYNLSEWYLRCYHFLQNCKRKLLK